jgi:hypothetical protein
MAYNGRNGWATPKPKTVTKPPMQATKKILGYFIPDFKAEPQIGEGREYLKT